MQLQAGVAGLKAAEVARLKKAVSALSVDRLFAAYDGEVLHLVPDVPKRSLPVWEEASAQAAAILLDAVLPRRAGPLSWLMAALPAASRRMYLRTSDRTYLRTCEYLRRPRGKLYGRLCSSQCSCVTFPSRRRPARVGHAPGYPPVARGTP